MNIVKLAENIVNTLRDSYERKWIVQYNHIDKWLSDKFSVINPTIVMDSGSSLSCNDITSGGDRNI